MDLLQLFGGSDSITNLLLIVFFFGVFPLLYPRLQLMQAIFKFEQISRTLDNYTAQAKKIVARKISKNPSPEVREKINNFMEFYVIEPVALDPYGIVKKVEHLVNLSDKRFKYFVENVAPQMDSENQANLMMGLTGAISLNQITKIVRHFSELVKKTRNWQLGQILLFQIALVERIAKSLLTGTESLTNGWPIGDSIGAFVIANLVENERLEEIEEDTMLARKKIKGRDVFLIKAKGPGGRLGRLGKAVEKIAKTGNLAKIITIDAAAKLEGEKTGSVAEGVGVAIGGPGVDRTYIENLATKLEIPLDSIIVKMSGEEAIEPIRKEVIETVAKVIQMVEANVERTREKGKIIIVGVGNTGGVGNNKKAARESEEQAKKVLNIVKIRKEDEHKKRHWYQKLFRSKPKEE